VQNLYRLHKNPENRVFSFPIAQKDVDNWCITVENRDSMGITFNISPWQIYFLCLPNPLFRGHVFRQAVYSFTTHPTRKKQNDRHPRLSFFVPAPSPKYPRLPTCFRRYRKATRVTFVHIQPTLRAIYPYRGKKNESKKQSTNPQALLLL